MKYTIQDIAPLTLFLATAVHFVVPKSYDNQIIFVDVTSLSQFLSAQLILQLMK